MPTWELQLALTVDSGIRTTVVVPLPPGDEFLSVCHDVSLQFALDPARHRLVPLSESAHQEMSRKQLMVRRDSEIVNRSELLLPISLRPGGSLETLMGEREAAGAIIDDRFQTGYQTRRSALGYIVTNEEYNTECDRIGSDFLIHWTRTSNSAWPEERLIDYYRAIAASSHYPRSALETLSRMLKMRCIVASSRHMAAGVRSVAFSALTVREALPLMHWRARYRFMSFEPYGIGIRTETALRMGVKPVEYCDSKEIPADESVRWMYQSRGERGDWPAEQEWRFPGDFSLDLSRGDMVALCRYPEEAGIIADRHGVPTLSVTTSRW